MECDMILTKSVDLIKNTLNFKDNVKMHSPHLKKEK